MNVVGRLTDVYEKIDFEVVSAVYERSKKDVKNQVYEPNIGTTLDSWDHNLNRLFITADPRAYGEFPQKRSQRLSGKGKEKTDKPEKAETEYRYAKANRHWVENVEELQV